MRSNWLTNNIYYQWITADSKYCFKEFFGGNLGSDETHCIFKIYGMVSYYTYT